ncbi:5462_t:CDS:1 [Funneliformis mosseae]|uniref:5462_t:CDS:1 n=1 Tax=Funneliformis mosseae TaxID=27381 RepID=A0A9N9DAQ6_FUNMO|nr:5462_t:CDS:1 [Funneliformis mosseae]
MDLNNNTNKTLENLKNRIKELEQGKKKSDDENRLLHTFLLNEIGSKELDNLRILLAGQKLTEILAELEERRQEVHNLNFDLKIMREEFSKLRSQFKDLEKEVKMRKEET